MPYLQIKKAKTVFLNCDIWFQIVWFTKQTQLSDVGHAEGGCEALFFFWMTLGNSICETLEILNTTEA